MKNLIATIIIIATVSILFARLSPKAWPFWLGFALCIITQSFLVFVYCFIKIQKAYRDTFTIKLVENHSMKFQEQYRFSEFIVGTDFFLNKYTEQARLFNKKQSMKYAKLQQTIQQVNLGDAVYKQQINNYMQRIRNKYYFLNQINQTLINFGLRLAIVSQKSFIIRDSYQFSLKQQSFTNDNFSSQFKDQQRRAFNQLKIKLKSPKIKSQQNIFQTIKIIDGLPEQIVLPTWKAIFVALQKIGIQFKKIQQIKQSNSDILEMIHQKINEDYQFLQKQVQLAIKTIEQIKQNLQNLKNEQQKLQKYQTNIQNNDNIEIIYWLKKQYFQFTNLSLRIKQNQKNYKVQIQKVGYYKSKLDTFHKKQQQKYDKIIMTRYISFLDSYSITLQQSLNLIKKIFDQDGYNYVLASRPPKVKQMIKSKNMNDVIAAQNTYQEQYFERIEYYLKKVKDMLIQLQQMDSFLNKLKNIFGQIITNLTYQQKNINTYKNKKQKPQKKYFQKLFDNLEHQSKRMFQIIKNLQHVNQSLLNQNKNQLIQMQTYIREQQNKSIQILSSLDINQGPVRQKYKAAKQQLKSIYKQMQEFIGDIKLFENIYLRHMNRIKKIFLVSIIQFLTNQKRLIAFDGDSDTFTKPFYEQSQNQDNLLQTTGYDNRNQVTQDINLQKINHLESGYILSEEHTRLINRFAFVAYTQWSKSQIFKQTIMKQLYISFNEEINQSFAQIIIQDFQLSGFPPQALWVKQLRSEEGQFIIDLNLAFRGKIVIKISTKYLTFVTIPVEIQITIDQFYSIMRLCFITNQMGCSWFSFVGEPLHKMTFKPKIGNFTIDMDSVANMFQRTITKKLKQIIYPIKKKISIPLYKKDDSYQKIKNRFQSMKI